MPRLALLIVLLLTPTAWAEPEGWAQAQRLFDQARAQPTATQAERRESRARYRQAAEAFAALHENAGVHSARLFVNTGNAYAFADDPGRAALYYRRALLLEPENPRAAAGLAELRQQLPWQRPPSVAADLLGTLFFWHQGLSFSARRWLFLVVWPLAFGLLLGAGRRRALLWAAAPALLAGAALFVSLALSAHALPPDQQAVLLVTTDGRTGDGRSYSPSHSSPLPAGSELQILEVRATPEAWLHVRLPDGSDAWIPTDAAARLVER